jgi:hypothetical protein
METDCALCQVRAEAEETVDDIKISASFVEVRTDAKETVDDLKITMSYV